MKRSALTYSLAAILSAASISAGANTLQEIYLLALENDHQLKADEAAYRAGLEQKTILRADLLPQINATATYSDTTQDLDNVRSFIFQDDSDPNAPPTVTRSETVGEEETETTTYTVSLTQPLFNLTAWFDYKRGVVLGEQAEAQFGADQQALIIRVSEAYFNVLRAVDNLETSIAEEKALGHQLEQTKQRFEVGLTAITDVHEAQASFDDATAVTLEARGNLGIAFEALEVITGTSHEAIAPLQEKFPVVNPEPAARHEWVDFALKNNYALKVAKLAAEASRQNSRARRSGHLPTLVGNLNYRDSSGDGIDTEDFDTSSDVEEQTISIELTVPLYSGSRISGQRRQAYQQFLQNQELYNRTQRDTIQQARSFHLEVVTDVAQVKARAQAITSSLSALEATQAGYDVGTRNLVDVLVAQRNVYQARRNYSDALFDYVVNMLRLKEVAGNLSPEDVIKLNQWLEAGKPISRAQYEK
ncbi:TolC family outer membrane protein [Exilibacterium tricleocarpae]|uniref:TolC family outer membrane protein n=1 Tax=Exilibacterium tricleocarpae TaxID=2591008 RepID=A0A545TFE4_9GAMM|nr:TolC family outer membrane protein [Exilibacterium tricleocarpae]TQV75928.1 TolC family outer membrane protein [Exilibacterium tricleocarpae]